MRCSRCQPIKRPLEFEAGGGLAKEVTKHVNPWWSFDLKVGYGLSWKQRKISTKHKKAEGKTVRCYSYENDRRTYKTLVNEGTKFYCVELVHNDFSLNVDNGKKAPKMKKAHDNNV